MNFLELAARRQSGRRYDPRPVDRAVIERCLEAVRLAPSACNSQPWTFLVLDRDEQRNRVADAAFSGVYSINAFARKAPVLVVVITERSKYMARLGGQFRGIQYSLVDIGIACEHFALQAAEEGLETCWLGWFNEKGVKAALRLPHETRIDIILAAGYPEAEEVRTKKRKTMDEIRRYVE